jgi:hypothetical protein
MKTRLILTAMVLLVLAGCNAGTPMSFIETFARGEFIPCNERTPVGGRQAACYEVLEKANNKSR